MPLFRSLVACLGLDIKSGTSPLSSEGVEPNTGLVTAGSATSPTAASTLGAGRRWYALMHRSDSSKSQAQQPHARLRKSRRQHRDALRYRVRVHASVAVGQHGLTKRRVLPVSLRLLMIRMFWPCSQNQCVTAIAERHDIALLQPQ